MKLINEVLKKDPDYASLLNEVERGRLPIVCTGLSLIHKAIIAASLRGHTGKRVVLITHDEATAAELCGDINALGLKCLNFPARDLCIGDLSGYSKEYEHKRSRILMRLQRRKILHARVQKDRGNDPRPVPLRNRREMITSL